MNKEPENELVDFVTINGETMTIDEYRARAIDGEFGHSQKLFYEWLGRDDHFSFVGDDRGFTKEADQTINDQLEYSEARVRQITNALNKMRTNGTTLSFETFESNGGLASGSDPACCGDLVCGCDKDEKSFKKWVDSVCEIKTTTPLYEGDSDYRYPTYETDVIMNHLRTYEELLDQLEGDGLTLDDVINFGSIIDKVRT